MNVKFLNPFLESAHEILLAETHQTLNRGKLSVEKASYKTDDVTVIIALVGNIEGNVFYSMDTKTAIALASAMLGEEMTSLDNLALSGISELGNVITGRASQKLSEAGFEVTISPPTLVLGAGATISTLDFPRLVVPLEAQCGIITVHLALRDGVRTALKAADIPVPQRPTFPVG
jgi:chemotaxis protein CheX